MQRAVAMRFHFSGLAALTALTTAPLLRAEVETEVEAGVVFVGRNDARIPGNGGTKISLVDDLSTDPAPVFRVRLGYRFAERHLVTALYAPLELVSTGSIDRDVDFYGGEYPAGTPVVAVYRFDSYRLTYRYSFVRRAGVDLAVGATGKIRDAETSLYGADARSKTNTGFVPLLNLHLAYRPDDFPIGVVLDADALVAPQGRAEDVLLALSWNVRDGMELRAGYRTLEGGADNEEVYSFAWFHYAVVGFLLTI